MYSDLEHCLQPSYHSSSLKFVIFLYLKVKENKEEAQERFVEIQKAYENLSRIKSRRARANRKVVTEDSTETQRQEEERQEKERQEEELREEWNDAFSEELDPKLEL